MTEDQYNQRIYQLIREDKVTHADWGSYNESPVGDSVFIYAQKIFDCLGADEVYPLSYGDNTADMFPESKSGLAIEIDGMSIEIWPFTR